MKARLCVSLSCVLVAMVLGAIGCTPVVHRTDEGEGGDDAACPEPNEVPPAPKVQECPAKISPESCTFTHPECPADRPLARYYTHGAHDCDLAYPPLHCEYTADVTCEGETLGVWCCP